MSPDERRANTDRHQAALQAVLTAERDLKEVEQLCLRRLTDTQTPSAQRREALEVLIPAMESYLDACDALARGWGAAPDPEIKAFMAHAEESLTRRRELLERLMQELYDLRRGDV